MNPITEDYTHTHESEKENASDRGMEKFETSRNKMYNLHRNDVEIVRKFIAWTK